MPNKSVLIEIASLIVCWGVHPWSQKHPGPLGTKKKHDNSPTFPPFSTNVTFQSLTFQVLTALQAN